MIQRAIQQTAYRWIGVVGMGVACLLAGCAHQGLNEEGGPRAGTPSTGTAAPSGENDARRRARIRLELAATYLQSGQTNVALEEIRQALALDSSYADVYHLRGLVFLEMEDMERAERDIKRAHSMSPNDPDILHNYGWLECQKKRYAEADRWFAQALKTYGYASPEKTYLSQGICQQRAGRSEQAEQSLMQAYEIDPSNPSIGYHLASVLFARGDAKRAQFYARRVNNSEFATAASLWLGIKIERNLREFTNMRQLGNQLVKRFPKSKETEAFDKGAFDE